MKNRALKRLLLVLSAVCALCVPTFAAGLAAVNLLFCFAVMGLHAAALKLSAGRPVLRPARMTQPCAGSSALPMVSVHVPTHNEPPEVVLATLEALSRIRYPNYEVIILDNNTSLESVWTPVREFALRRGAPFRFFHYDNVAGHKAGALNLARKLSHPLTRFIMVVDADYRVAPNALAHAVALFLQRPDLSHIQFPQFYRGPAASPLLDEFQHYFDVFMNAASELNSVLLTGTLSVIRTEALDAVGGWSSRSITEDAELGMLLLINGFRGEYVPVVAGRGLAPDNLLDLRRQRRRWIFGNAQSLATLRQGVVSRKQIDLRSAVGAAIQLSAWFNFLLVPLFLLITYGLTNRGEAVGAVVLLISSATVFSYIIFKLFFFQIYSSRRGSGFTGGVQTFTVHLATLAEGASAWPAALFGGSLGFDRTDKSGRNAGTSCSTGQAALLLLLALLLSASAALMFADGTALPAAAALLSAVLLTAPLWASGALINPSSAENSSLERFKETALAEL